MKKMLTLILAFAVLLSIIPFSTLAVSAQTLTDEGYYLIGDMNDWKIDKDYKFQEYGSSSYRGIMFYGKDIQGDETFQIVYSADGKAVSDNHSVYPEKDRSYNENREVFQYGAFKWYVLYFYPNGSAYDDGDYVDGYLFVRLLEPSEDSTEAPTQAGDLYRERLKESYNLAEYDASVGFYTNHLMYYKELYYHRDENNDIDWALINCYCNVSSPIEYTNVVGNRVLHPGTQYYPFDTCYGIYDVKNDKFVDATNKAAYQYDNFVSAFDEIVSSGKGLSMADIDNRGKGRPLGDIDNDNELTVVDVTLIQRCEAQMMEYPSTDEFMITYDFNTIHYYSDFNRDGERDILDATCIQRYLVGIAYPKG